MTWALPRGLAPRGCTASELPRTCPELLLGKGGAASTQSSQTTPDQEDLGKYQPLSKDEVLWELITDSGFRGQAVSEYGL